MLAGEREMTGFLKKKNVIDRSFQKVFDFEYPIFDEAYRPVLEKKILNHYYMREIGAETIGLWQHYLDQKLNEVMPYYNQLYESQLLEFNPLYDVDLTTEFEREEDRTATTKSKTDTTDESKSTGKETTDTGTVGSDTIKETGSADTSSLSTTTDDGRSTSETSTSSKATSDSSSDTNNKHDNWDLSLDTPQGSLTNMYNSGPNGADTGGNYLDLAKHMYGNDTSSSSANSTTTGTGSEDVTSTVDNTSTTTGSINQNDTRDTTRNTTQDTDSTTNTEMDNIRTGLSNTDTNDKIDTLENYIQKVSGKRSGGSYSKMLNEFRSTFLNVDKMVIEELENCFYQLW